MKILGWLTAGGIGLVAIVLIAQTAASERIEVVELHTLDAAGAEITTRLWVIGHDNYAWHPISLPDPADER